MDLLQEARQIINQVDAQMADLFVQRMHAAQMVAEYKKANGMPILDAQREQVVIRNGSARVEDPCLREYYVEFMQDTMAISRRYQQWLLHGMQVAYWGAEDTFAHIAADRLFPDAQKVSFSDFKAAYDSVVNGQCDVVVLPLENSPDGELAQLLLCGPLYVNRILPLSPEEDMPGSGEKIVRFAVLSRSEKL